MGFNATLSHIVGYPVISIINGLKATHKKIRLNIIMIILQEMVRGTALIMLLENIFFCSFRR